MSDTTTRDSHLREILVGRQRELQADVQRRIRDGRNDNAKDVRDEVEHSDATITEDVEFALLQMKSETLRRVDEALARLETGDYGSCFSCGNAISETRLRALPFAVRCKSCEERREKGQAARWRVEKQKTNPMLFSEIVGGS